MFHSRRSFLQTSANGFGYLAFSALAARAAAAADGHEVIDLGTHSLDSVDYPDYGAAVARAVVAGCMSDDALSSSASSSLRLDSSSQWSTATVARVSGGT